MDREPAALEDVLIAPELARRPTRNPNYEAENRALTALAEGMAAPQSILQKLVETALDLCRADSAGISILEPGGATGIFRWHAIAGAFASHVGEGIPREASPCGLVLDRDAWLLFAYPERHFQYGIAVNPPIVEALVVPFHVGGNPGGALWAIAHTPSRQFDIEDLRLLTSLSRFAAAAHQTKAAVLTTVRAKDEVHQILDTAATGITRCSRDLRYLSANPAYAKLAGLSAEQIIGRPIVEVMGSKAFEVIRPYVERVLRGERVEYEEEIPFAAGETRFLHVAYTPWVDDEGQVAGWVASVSDITNSTALRESEERLRLAVSSGTIGIWDWSLTNDRLTWSPELCDIYGVEAGTARTYEDFSSRVHPDDLAAVESVRNTGIRSHKQFSFEFRIIRPSGEIRWISAKGQGYYDESGRVVRVVGNNIDITERKRLELALREREQRLRLALEASRAGSWMRDVRTGRIDWDDRFREIYGFTTEEPASFEAWLGRVHEEDRRQELDLWDQIVRTRTHDTLDSTFRIVRSDGTVSWIQSLGQVHRDADGRVMRLTGLDLDVTARRRAEEAVRQQARMLHLSFDAIFVWRFDGVIESWNRGARTLYGFTESEAISQNPHDLLHTIFPVSCSKTKTVLKEQGEWEGELRQRTKDGRKVVVSARFQLIPSDDGTIRVLEINRDITQRKRMEEERIEEERHKDEFLSLLGHELRNPLAAISTAVQLMSGGVSDEEHFPLNEMMDRQVKLMQRLLDDLLDLGRITHGYIQLKKERVDLAKLLQHVTEVTQSAAASRGQEMILRLPSEVVLFKADEARLEQIAINLLNNAAKYTPQGGRIEFSGAREGSEVVLRCKDSGRGIPLEMQQKIFEPFTRIGPLSDSRGEASLGIGLALVKRLVELHGGRISVESGGLGTGSEFLVRLPLEPALADQPFAPETKPAPSLRRSRSIVLVEDNSDVASTMMVALKQAGYQVTLFADAFSALTGLSDLKPDAILLDIGLPGMDGYELARKLKTKPNLRHALFIAISGFKRRERAEADDDFDHYFTKPVDLSSLLNLLGSTPAQAGQATDATAGTAPGKTTLRVLLIDDHAALSAAMAELLNREGLEVRTALSGEAGLQVASDFRPQLILCDLNLPDMTGREVIRRLCPNPVDRRVYSVILTALSQAEIRTFNEEAKEMGVDEFIPKPLTPEVIHSLVAKLKL
jgi:PAS domain S-box-containing protein